MKPYYEQDEVTIYHGNTREILSALGPFDALISDPPCPNAYADIQGKEDPERLLLSILVCKKIRRHQGVNRWIITIARKPPRGMPDFSCHFAQAKAAWVATSPHQGRLPHHLREGGRRRLP